MNITLIISVAILIEALVEYGKSIVDMFEGGDRKTGITQLITIACGIFMAFAFKVNAFDVLGITVDPTIGTILTGIVMSRGSNYASDLLSKLTK